MKECVWAKEVPCVSNKASDAGRVLATFRADRSDLLRDEGHGGWTVILGDDSSVADIRWGFLCV
jgi:hypothetical protein